MRIGCDIGGVIKQMTNDQPISGAIAGLNQLFQLGHSVILISKCKETYRNQIDDWLKSQNLTYIPVRYCGEYADKVNIAKELKLEVMIDDKMQVLSSFSDQFLKIWLCDEEKKISGAKKYQPDLFKTLRLAKNWEQILVILSQLD